MKKSFFSFSFFIIFIFYLIAYKSLGKNLAWISFPIALLFIQWFQFKIFKGLLVFYKLSQERISLNILPHKHSPIALKKKFLLHFFLFLTILVTCSLYVFRYEILDSYYFIYNGIRPTSVTLKIQYPSYLDSPPRFVTLTENLTEISIDTAYFLDLNIFPVKEKSKWKLNISNASNGKKTLYAFPKSGNWSSSSMALFHEFSNEENSNKSIVLNFEIEDSSNKKIAKVILSKTPFPLVELQAITPPEEDYEKSFGKLFFHVNASSAVPLSAVELIVRTKSGYSFNKTLAEFANGNKLQFSTVNAEIVTLGIPFTSEDFLYVKAVAKTVLSDLKGESNEIEFPIKTSIQVRKELIKNLELTLKVLNKLSNAQSPEKKQALDLLFKSFKIAEQLGRGGVVLKSIVEAMDKAEKITRKNDINYNFTVDKINSILDILKRQQKIDEGNQFFARLNALKGKVSQAHDDLIKEQLVQETIELKLSSMQLNRQLNDYLITQKSLFTKQELETAKSLLAKDKTAIHLNDLARELDKMDFLQAQKTIHKTQEDAVKNLGTVMQLVQNARMRAIQLAKNHLHEADAKIESARSIDELKEKQKNLKDAQTHLSQTPLINPRFNEALQEAKKQTAQAIQQQSRKGHSDVSKSLNTAQESIERALLVLQEEENSDKDLQKEQDARALRSSMDILASQGVLDSSWRKFILEEIARLKNQGESSDSPMIRYLESRLR